jgi:hypothetical protein
MEFVADETNRVEHRRPVGRVGETGGADFEFDDPTLVAFGVVALLWIGLLMVCFVL